MDDDIDRAAELLARRLYDALLASGAPFCAVSPLESTGIVTIDGEFDLMAAARRLLADGLITPEHGNNP